MNGQPLEFRLETERSVADVSAGVEKWLASGGLCVVAVRADGQEVSTTAALAITSTRRLDFTVAPLSEARLAALRTTTRYLDLFEDALSRKDRQLLDDLSAGYPSMVEGIRGLLAPQPGSDLHTRLVALDGLLAGNTPERIVAWPAETAAGALSSVRAIRAWVTAKTGEWDDPPAALAALRLQLERAIVDAAEVSVLLQTGREREAMARIITFSELAQSYLAVVERILERTPVPPPLVGGESLHVFGGSLNGVLKQLLEAFHARDTVLIGDLLEYEVAPRIRELIHSTTGLERSRSGES